MTSLRFPETVELADSQRRMAGATVGATACGIAGLLVVWSGSVVGWVAVAMGAVALPFFVVLTARPPRLVVDPDGFGLQTPFGREFVAWTEADDFRAVTRLGESGRRVSVRYRVRGRRLRGVIRAELDVDPFTLAEQLQRYRSDALAAR